MGVVSWIILGFLAGSLAKFMMPGNTPGIVIAVALGMLGALAGGFLGTRVGFGGVTGFDLRSAALAVAGSVLLLFGHRLLKKA